MPAASLSAQYPNVPPLCPTVQSLSVALEDLSIHVSADQLLSALDELNAFWVRYQTDAEPWAMVAMYRQFEMDVDHPGLVDVDQLELTMQTSVTTCMRLYQRMRKAELIQEDEQDHPLKKRLVRVIHVISNSYKTVLANYHRYESTKSNHLETVHDNAMYPWEVDIGLRMFNEEELKKMKATQRVILFVLENAYARNLRRYRGALYHQVVLHQEDGHTVYTHAWEHYSDIKPFIYKLIQKNTSIQMWLDLTSGANVAGQVEEYLLNGVDFELPSIELTRHIFSFSNGLYNAMTDQMYTYETVPQNTVAAKYFNVRFPFEQHATVDFRQIPTPALDNILAHQKLPTELYVPAEFLDNPQYLELSVRDWVYVFMGRMIYPINVHDQWQAIMFLKGAAGTGKSTIGKVLHALYNDADVGVLSNNTEIKFGLSALVEKLIYLCYEVKHDFKLDQGEMQSMISGEPISIATKNKTARSVVWNSHGFFMGNEFPNWTNNSGSIGRRIITVLFNEVVDESDPHLFNRLEDEMGYIILKINRAYRQAAVAYGNVDIWRVLPDYFLRVRRQELEANTHPLAAFFVYIKYSDDGKTLVLDPDGTIPFRYFQQLTHHYMKEHNINPSKFKINVDFYASTFRTYRISIVRLEGQSGEFLQGIRVGYDPPIQFH